MAHTHESYTQHIDMVFHPSNIRVEEVRHHTGHRRVSKKMDHLAEYGGIRNRKLLLPLGTATRWRRATHPSELRHVREGHGGWRKCGALVAFDR